MEVAIVFMFLFAVIFGIFYLYFLTRNKERLALIEKGVDATIFMKGQVQNKNAAPFWKVFILNISLLLMGVGLGVFLALILDTYTDLGQPIYPATVFFTAGLCLFIGFNLTKKLDK